MSKIFGDFESVADLNECAKNLLDNNEIDDLKTLADENGVDAETLERFIDRKIPELVAVGEETPADADAVEPPSKEVTGETHTSEPPPPPNETAPERLQREIKGAKNKNVPTVPIAKRLTELCETNTMLAAQILLPHKSLEKCFSHVEEQARKKCTGGRGWIDDEEVYQMAVDYYNLDDAEAERKKEENRKKREEESKKRAVEAKKRAAERAEAAKNAPPNAAKSSTPAKPGTKPEPKNAPSDDQLTLWG